MKDTHNIDDNQRLALIIEAVLYCQRVKDLRMPVSAYTKALREPIHFLWERRAGSKKRCAKWRSKEAVGKKQHELVYDHAIPFKYLQDKLIELKPVTEVAVRDLLERFCATAWITKEENADLNRRGLGRKMPEAWDGVDPLARYAVAGIVLTRTTELGRDMACRRKAGSVS